MTAKRTRPAIVSQSGGPKGKIKQTTAKARPPAEAKTPDDFAAILKALAPKPITQVARAILLHAPLAHLDYKEELGVKNAALRSFWQQHRLPGEPEPVVVSPRPRGYRTTSKRRAELRGGVLRLFYGDKAPLPQKETFLASPLEPEEHGAIYSFLQKKLCDPAFRSAAAHLHYVVIRGTYAEQAVIFNVDKLDGQLVRKFKLLAGHLQKLPLPVSAVFLFLDPDRSDYYLESRRPSDTIHFKKLFGPDQLTVSFADCRYRFHPTSFSQVNEAMMPVILEKVRELLGPVKEGNLLDLYCGYGLFSHFLAPDFKQVTGMDLGGHAIRAAEANRRLNAKRGGRTSFLARRISGHSLHEYLSSNKSPDAVVLDPPRQGPDPGVVATLCRSRPDTVVHIFCGIDQIPSGIKEWRGGGYTVRRIVPLDLFPGTANLEVVVLLTSEKG